MAIADTVSALRTELANWALQSPVTDSNIEQFGAHLDRISLAWPVKLSAVTLPNHRRRALLAAPLFTSDAYPWPREKGRWLEPVFQIDLASLAALKPLPLGSGWLQVWATDSGATTRIIPAEHVATAPIAALPSTNPTDSHCNRVAAADEPGAIGWLPGQRITRFGGPFLDYGHNDLGSGLIAWASRRA